MLEAFTGSKRFFVRFQYGFKKELIMNQLVFVKVERIPKTEEADVTKIYIIPDKTVYFKKGYYYGAY